MQQVRNRAPAEVQITAEQLIRTARDHQIDDEKKIAQLKLSTRVNDAEELKLHQAEKRREFEDRLRHTAVNTGTYIRYAKWEESQMEYRRARSIFERALEVDHREYTLWLKYAEFEMRNKFVNHARNVFDRAVAHLPRMNQLWYKYTFFEELIGEIDKCRLVFERWMQWQPAEQAWFSYVNFEVRQGELARARMVYEKFCGCYPRAKSYIKYAKWEQSNSQYALARSIYERALDELDQKEAKKQSLFIAFAHFEERCKEYDRARAIYKQALSMLPKEQSRDLYDAFVAFERQHGDRNSIENVLVEKRRTQFEQQLEGESHNYDIWFDYTRLEQAQAQAEAAAAREYLEAVSSATEGSASSSLFKDKTYASKVVTEARERVRAVFDRAVACVPPSKSEKRLWKRYIYLWINYALFEEMEVEDIEKARSVYAKCLEIIPHKKFTFSKVWILAANFEIRQQNLEGARKIFGRAIGRCPRDKTFKAYIQLELQLGNVDRCRTLYGKYLEFAPQNCFIWEKYAELEKSVGEIARSRAIYEIAVEQPTLDMPETLWKRYIDFEIGLKNKTGRSNAQELYERLLERTQHVKVWISYAKFEALHNSSPERSREIFDKAYKLKKEQQKGDDDIAVKEDRALLLSAWLETERKLLKRDENDNEQVKRVEDLVARQPRKVKKKKQIEDDGGWEEYYDYMFPDDPKRGLQLLQISKQWKRNRTTTETTSEVAKKPKSADENEIDLDDI